MKYVRLTRPEDFRLVYTQGRVRFGKYLALHCVPTNTENRVGISVSKKVGNAVTRNAVKRKLREVINCFTASMPHGYSIVIGAKANSRTATFWQLKEDIRRLLKGLSLLT